MDEAGPHRRRDRQAIVGPVRIRPRATCIRMRVRAEERLERAAVGMLRVVVPDIAAFDALHKRLTETPGLADVTICFEIGIIKHATVLPVQ